MSVKIYHNPRCSKSRQTLQLLEEQGVQAEVIEYLKTPPSAAELDEVLKLLNIEPRALMRTKEAEYKATGMDNPDLDRAALIAGMVASPKLIERPIVISNGKAAIGILSSDCSQTVDILGTVRIIASAPSMDSMPREICCAIVLVAPLLL
jgi:arsenate reductase